MKHAASVKAEGIVAILLAAGSSHRFGDDKLMYRLPNKNPMAVASAIQLCAAFRHVIAVVRPERDALAKLLAAAGCEVVLCHDAQRGMGHSLAAGVQAARHASAWVVALGDMPFIKSTTHQTVAASLRSGASLAASEYQGRRGHPVGFSSRWFDQLITLTGDAGGKTILQSNPDDVVLCAVDDPGVLQDFDFKEDVQIMMKFAASDGR